MDPIRVVFAALPKLLRDILRQSMLSESDITVVGEVSDLVALKGMVAQGRVDVVVLGLSEDGLPPPHYELFDADPRVRILAIADHGRTISLYDLQPHRSWLGEASPQDLLKVIRERGRLSPGRRGTTIQA